jgi:hypothetical protein
LRPGNSFRYFALFSLFCTVFTIWKHLEALEAFGSSQLSLFCTALTLKRQNSENSEPPHASKTNASKCFQMAKTVQNSENSFLVFITLP